MDEDDDDDSSSDGDTDTDSDSDHAAPPPRPRGGPVPPGQQMMATSLWHPSRGSPTVIELVETKDKEGYFPIVVHNTTDWNKPTIIEIPDEPRRCYANLKVE